MPRRLVDSQKRDISVTRMACGNGCRSWDGEADRSRYVSGRSAAGIRARNLLSARTKKEKNGLAWVGRGPSNSVARRQVRLTGALLRGELSSQIMTNSPEVESGRED